MHIDKVHPELRKATQGLPSLPFRHRWLWPVIRLLFRFFARTKVVEGVEVAEYKVDKNARARVYRPQGGSCGAGLLWIHGGGLIVGMPRQNDRLCSIYARDLNLVVVSVGYRLAPKHRFPSAIDDCLAVWQWLQGSAAMLGLEKERVALGGESAGGGLAACLAQRILDAGGVQPLAQVLYCPMLDDRTAANRDLDKAKHFIWDNYNNHNAWGAYLGEAPGGPSLPAYAVAARRENLAGLPPAWIGVGDIDLFYEEDRRYAERLNTAGVYCEFDDVPMAPHGFHSYAEDVPISRAFYQRNHNFLREKLGVG